MTNIYLLEKKKTGLSAKGRQILRTAVHIFFVIGVILSAIGIVGMVAGAEFGPIMLGRRLLAVAMLIIMLWASAIGARMTYVELPLDGGEEDE